MKISEMPFEQASAVMLRLAAPISNLCDDEELMKIGEDFVAAQNRPKLYAYGQAIPRLLTYALEKHKADTYEILCALLGMTKTEVAAAPLKKIIDGLRDSWDEVLAGFFSRSKPAGKSSGTES